MNHIERQKAHDTEVARCKGILELLENLSKQDHYNNDFRRGVAVWLVKEMLPKKEENQE